MPELSLRFLRRVVTPRQTAARIPTSMNPKNVVLAAGMGASHTLSPNSEPNARNSLMIPTANAAIA